MDIKKYTALKGYNIIVGDYYICFLGTKLVIWDMQQNEVCTFSDMRDYAWAAFLNGHYLIARNARCTYKVYDLREKMCVHTYTAYKKNFYPYGLPVLDAQKGILYDAFYTGQFEKKQVISLQVNSGEFQYIDYLYPGNLGDHAKMDEDSNYCFIHYKHILRDTKTVLSPEIAYMKGGDFFFQPLREPVYFRVDLFMDQFLILQNDELIWLESGNRMKLNVPEQKRGFLHSGIYDENREYLTLAYHDCVCTMNLRTNNCIFFYPEEFVSDVKLIGDDLYIGTWKKTVCLRRFKQEVLDTD